MDKNENTRLAEKIAAAVDRAGGTVYYVGGYVRDMLMGEDNKDIDIEVHGVAPEKLTEILGEFGEIISIGQSFGVYALKGYSIDIAVPRKEKAVGKGHKDFEISVDSFLGVENAAKRRDFTVNAIMQNVLTGEIIDPFSGCRDLEKKVLRHVCDESFPEDPLRVMRAAQFAARFEFSLAEQTAEICKKIPLDTLSRERIEGELKKALLKAEKPSIFFETLRKTDALDYWFPEVKALIAVEQNEKYHKEGDVWTHTMMVLDNAVKYRERVQNPFGFMLAALTHDFGKTVATRVTDGVAHAYGHETAGLPIAEKFLKRLTNETRLIEYVLNLTELHMKPNVAARDRVKRRTTNRLFDRAVDPEALIFLGLCDSLGKIPVQPPEDTEKFLFHRLRVYRETMAKPFVAGKDLINAGLTPNKNFSEILSFAHKLRLAGIEKQDALIQTLAYARKTPKE